MRRPITILAALSAVLVSATMALPATVAGASSPTSLWVSNVAPLTSAPGTNCTHPGFSTVQSALDAAPTSATVHVCAGTYTEQLVITQSVKLVSVGSVTVALPASPATATTPCDVAIDGGAPGIDEISICTSGTVAISGLTVQTEWNSASCNDNVYGILAAGGATLKASKVNVVGATNVPLNGCQGGVGIEVGASDATPVQTATATLKGVTVSDYQKNGITVDGAGSSAFIEASTVTGAGPTDQIGQNGIQISDGAKGVVKSGTTSSGNECDDVAGHCGSNPLTQVQAGGVLFMGAAHGSSLTDSTVSDNDMGVYYVSEAPAEPASAEVTISKDNFTANRYAQLELDQGFASLLSNVISGSGNIGIAVLQYDGQSYAPASKASKQNISGQGVGVDVLSDQSPGDLPGTFVISHSVFLTGNTTAEADNSNNYAIGGVDNS